MKEKILKFLKEHKLFVGIGFGTICATIIAVVAIGFLAQPASEEKKKPIIRHTDRVVMGPKTSVLFYQDFNNLERELTDGGSFSEEPNTLERITEGENSYAKMSRTSSAFCAYAATTTGVGLEDTEFIEISLSTDGTKIPEAVLCYPYDRSTTNATPRKNFLNIQPDGSIVVKSATLEGVETTIANLEVGKWVRIGIKFTPKDGRYIVYLYNETTKTFEEKVSNQNVPSVISPSYVRFQILSKDENVGTGILFDEFAVYTASTFIDLSKVEIPTPIKVTTGPDVEMDHPEMADIGEDGIVVMAGKGYAFVGEKKVSLAANTSETEIVTGEDDGISGFFQSIINFFKKLFGMKVEDHRVVQKDILVSGDFIKKYLQVDVKDTSKLYAIGEIAKETDKNVVYDDRGLIVITNPEIALDAEKDVKLLTMLYGLFETGEVISNYAAAPTYDQEVIDKAIETYAAKYPEAFVGTNAANKSTSALYYLTLISRTNPDAKHSTKDVTVVDAALKKLREIINGSGEPFASPGCWFGHGMVSSCFTLVKNTDVIYSKLTTEEIDRMDTIMAALAIAGNWQYNDANDYKTSFDLQGNMNDNANYRNAYLTTVINASLYFGPEKLDEIYTNFNYDTYMAKFEEYGLTNIYNKWIDIGYSNAKDLMEQGGDAYLIGLNGDYYASKVGSYAGTGKGVKQAFTYNGLGAEDVLEIFSEYQVAYTYAWKTISEYGTPGTISHCYILSDNKTSPYEGQMGMMLEYATVDSGDIRSRTGYVWDSFTNIIPLYTNMKLFGGWDSQTQRLRELDNRIWVGNEDMIYKMIEGYHGRSISYNYDEYEYQYVTVGYEFLKDIWYNFHCMQNTDITIIDNPDKTALTEIPKAEPMEGDGITPPEGAWEAVVKNGDQTMSDKAFYRFIEKGKAYVSGKIEFDFVIPDGIDENEYNVVVMLDQQDKNRKYADFNILFRLMSGWIEVYNGAASVSDYIPTDLRFGPNYRFHVEWEWDAETKSSQIKITQIWPETNKEISYTSKRLKFRATGDTIEGINSLVLVKNDVGSPFWVENFKLVETGEIVDVIDSEPDLERIPGAYYQNDFNDKTRKVSYNANSNARGNKYSLVWDEESKNGWLNMEIAGTRSSYYRPKINGADPDETLVVEFEVSTDGTVAKTSLMYPYKSKPEAEKTSNNSMIGIGDNVVTCGGEQVAKITPGKWTRIGIIFTPSTGDVAVYEYNQSKGIYERRVFQEMNPSVIAPTYLQFFVAGDQKNGNNILIDDMSIYEGTEFYFDKKIDTTGVYLKNTKKNNIETPEGYYYWSDYNVENCNVKYDAQTKSSGAYDYTQGFDADGNGYMSVDSIAGKTSSSFFRARVEGAKKGDYIITEISLRAGQNGTPKFSLMYDYNKVNGSTKTKSFFGVSEEKGRVLGSSSLISSLSTSTWTKLGVIFNQKTGAYTVYEYDEASKTYVWKGEGTASATAEGFPTFVGLQVSAPSTADAARSVHVDNFFVYGSDKASFKEGTVGAKPKFDGVYYSQDYSDADLWDIGIVRYNGGGYDCTRRVDSDGNAYVRMQPKKDSNRMDYFRVNLEELSEDPNKKVVVEMSLRAGEEGVPAFSLEYEIIEGKTQKPFDAEKGTFKLLGKKTVISSMSAGQWTRVGMILDLETGDYTLYEYDKNTNTYVWKEEGHRDLGDGEPAWIRLTFAGRTEANNCYLDVDDYKIYSGNTFLGATTGEEPEFNGVYYEQNFDVGKFITANATMKSTSGYDFTQGVDADGNGYLKVTSKEGQNLNSYFRASASGVSEEDSIVVEMKVRAGSVGTPQFSFQFDRTTSAKSAFTVNALGDYVFNSDTGNSIAPMSKDNWTQIGFILNRSTGEYTIYRNIGGTYVAMETDSTTFANGKPTWFGFGIAAPGEGNVREFHVDDFTIYAGTKFQGSNIADGSNMGDISFNTVMENGVFNISNANTSEELLTGVLNSEEQLSVLVGQDATLTLNAGNVATDSNDTTVVSEALADRVLGSIFSLELMKQVGEGAEEEVSTLNASLRFAVTIPSGLANTDENLTRVYDVVRVNGNTVEKVDSTFNSTESTITFEAEALGTFAIMHSDYFYYGSYDGTDCNVVADATTSGYSFAQGTEMDGNGYLKVTSNGNSKGNFKANITGATDKTFVVEMKLKDGEYSVPEFSLYYDRTANATKWAYMVDGENGIYTSNKTIASITTDEWTQIGLVITDDGRVTIYRYVNNAYVEMDSYQSGFGPNLPTYIGFNITAPGKNTIKEFYVDDFKVYEGTQFRGNVIADPSNAGTIEVDTVVAEGALNITSKSVTDVLTTPLLSDEERLTVLAGVNANLTFNVGNVDANSADRTIVTEALSGRTLGSMFAMSFAKKIGEAPTADVTSTSTALEFELTLPDELRNTSESITRNYEVLRVDEGVLTTVESAFDKTSGKITFSTDRFGTFAIVYKDQVKGYMNDFNDALTLTPTLRSASALRYEDIYSEQIAFYARAHGNTNDATKNDFYGKKVDGDNSYLYMRSSGKSASGNPYYTAITFSNISVDVGTKPLWIEMDLKALDKIVHRYEFSVNGTSLFVETSAKGIADTGTHTLSESQFNKLALKFADGKCYAYINGANEIDLGEFTLESLDNFQIKLITGSSSADVIAAGNAGICIDNVAVYTSDTRQNLFGNGTN